MPPPTRSTVEASQERLQQLEERLQEVLDQQTTLQEENNLLQERVAVLTTLPVAQEREGELGPEAREQGQLRQTPPAPREPSLAPTHLTTTTSGGKTSEPKVASPEYYEGQRTKLSTFITQVTMVIVLQPTRFATEVAKVLYMGSYLRGTAFLWFQPYVTAEPQPGFMSDFKEFCKELRHTFGDPDEVATAERQLYALRQRGSVTSYLADFMRHAVLIKWNDEAKAAQFYRGLKDSIKDELSRIGRPSTLKGLEEAAIRIDTRLFERVVERGERTTVTGSSVGNPNRFTPGSNPGSNSQRPTITKTAYTAPQEHFRATFPNSLERLTKRGKLTPSEYQRRRDNDLCLYCGEKGHQVVNCPANMGRTRLAATTDDQEATASGAGKDQTSNLH